MKSDPAGEFFSSFVGIILLAAVVCIILLALFLAPVFGLAGVPVVAYIYHRNSPATKEKEARGRTEELFTQALALAAPDTDKHADRLFDSLVEPVRSVAAEIYNLEGIQPPPPVPPICNSVDGARYRDKLIRYINTVYDETRTDGFVDALIDCMPRYPETRGIFEATCQLTNAEVEKVITPFYGYEDHFRELKKKLDRNLDEQKGVFPSAYKGDNCAFAYLKDTPLLQLEKRNLRVGLEARFEHTQIVAGSGSGKTSLIEYMIHHDLEDDCSVVVIDSQRQLIDRLAKRPLWTGEVAYFSPHHKLGINLFDVKADQKMGEADVIGVIDLMEYVLSGLMDAKLTSKQETLFNYAVQLLMVIPGANLASFRRLLRKNGIEEFRSCLPKLPNEAREFFEQEFGQQSYASTKEEVMWRLDAMQRNPAFARIFTAIKNPIDMFDEMAERKLILVDTDVNHLGDKGSSFFGRFFIALILKAARQRFKGEHRRVYLYIDECAAYLDSRLELMLQQARKANIGVVLAHQDLEKARGVGILSTILGNTATKFAGRLADSDARVMAANMHTTPEFIKTLPRYHFAMSAIDRPTYAVTADTHVVRHAEVRTKNSYDLLIEEMERRYGWEPPPAQPGNDPEPPVPEPPRNNEVAPPPTPKAAKKSDPVPKKEDAPAQDDEIRPSPKL